MHEHLNAARDEELPEWSQERETRLLDAVLGQLDEEASEAPSANPMPTRRRWVWGTTGALVAAAALLLLRIAPSSEPSAPAGTATSTNELASSKASESELLFGEGTRALLDAGAQVSSVEQTPKSVSLKQSAGRVHYEVNPERRQRFQVTARGVVIEVLGTKFDVTVASDAVLIEVHRGVVAVQDGERRVKLRRGEELRVVPPDNRKSTEEVDSKQALSDRDNASDSLTLPAEGASLQKKPSSEHKDAPKGVDRVQELLKQADQARLKGDLATAEATLTQLSTQYGGGSRAISILFSLGRVQTARGKYRAAAATFGKVRTRTSRGLGEDALAEEAVCLSLSGQKGLAQTRARRYLASYPEGLHRDRMNKLVP